MRKVMDNQMMLGQVDISKVEFDPRSRDEIPQLLAGLQHIYCTPSLREEVFRILTDNIPSGKSAETGRPGMDLWPILVLGTVRLNCNWDFDKLKEMADNHLTLREMLGHVRWLDRDKYPLQTLRDNVSLLTPELLEKINVAVVEAGHSLIKKKDGHDELHGKCDSFVVETDVHFPTDINLLFDAMRKIITLVARMCELVGVPGWRQWQHNIEKIRGMYYRAGKMRRSNAKDPARRAQQERKIRDAYLELLSECQAFIERAKESLTRISGLVPQEQIELVENFIVHACRQIDQTDRRVLKGQTIFHGEKVFSVFQPHTRWIRKGKAGVSQELGLPVCVLTDQYGFILHHMVMETEGDERVAVAMVKGALAKFPNLVSCSFDRGFYTAANRTELNELLDTVVMPKSGGLSAADKLAEHQDDFIKARHKHAAVESDINALENHGLDRCPDDGIDGFKRYVGLAVLACNIQRLGRTVLERKRKLAKRRHRAAQALPNAA